ncbi:translation initiation factor IF-2-like [Patiria miniata]|uniref:Uncharacterized protein n=1 Tax=Patiria miniata TaxID=46514 RepID=A0A913YXJ9_PATMI|nr:translation initiation factor IF-2-like [Patiria miniata]
MERATTWAIPCVRPTRGTRRARSGLRSGQHSDWPGTVRWERRGRPARVGRVRPDIPPGPGTHGNQTARAGGRESGSPGPLAPRPPGGDPITPAALPRGRQQAGRRAAAPAAERAAAAARRAADRGGPPPRGDPADRGIETRGVGGQRAPGGQERARPGRPRKTEREPNGPCGGSRERMTPAPRPRPPRRVRPERDGRAPRPGEAARPARPREGYLVDPASSHMLVSKIKPCMSK